MKRIHLFVFTNLLSLCVGGGALAHDYWYKNITGNVSYQQTGDAVYVEGKEFNAWNHAGIFYDDNGKPMVIHVMVGGFQLINIVSFNGFKEGRSRYYGAHYSPGMSAKDRELIMEKAAAFYARRGDLNYTAFGQIDWYGSSWDGTIDDLDNVRCDGMVEVCYELSGIEVWAKNQRAGHYFIQDYPAEHNDMPDLLSAPEPDTEVCPVVQRGGPGIKYTRLRASDDRYEENDTLSKSFSLVHHRRTWLRDIRGPGIQLDPDWYRIAVSPGHERVKVDLRFTHANGDINLGLYCPSGARLCVSESKSDNEFIDYTVPRSGYYYLKVYHGNAGTPYNLWCDALKPNVKPHMPLSPSPSKGAQDEGGWTGVVQ